MNILQKKHTLINNIENYLNGKCSLNILREFSWDIIEYFSKTKKEKLPEYQEFEKEFWYVIWQIQHIADEFHENDNVTKKILIESLDYLKKTKHIPEKYIGTRP